MVGRALALAVVATAAGGALCAQGASVERAPGSAKVATSGNYSERIDTIPIRKRIRRWHTAMVLAPPELPRLRATDRLRISAELQTTTDCTKRLERCAGRPHRWSPTVATRLVIAGPGGRRVLDRDRQRRRQRPGDRQHHCPVTLGWTELRPAGPGRPCRSRRCRIKVLVAAASPRATGRERLVIGSQDPDGSIVHDKGRINVVRLRGGAGPLAARASSARLVNRAVRPDLRKRVVLSVRLDGLERGESLEVSAHARGHVAHLPYPALIGSQLILAESPRDRAPGPFVRRVASLGGELNEIAGSNCTQAQTPCPIRRVGVLRMRRAARRDGRPVPLYVNLVVRAMAKRADPQPGDAVRIENVRGLRVKRYPAP